MLILNFEHAVGLQDTAPMGHQALILLIIKNKVSPIVGEVDPPGEILEVIGQAGIDRVPHAMNDTSARENDVDESDRVEITW